MAQQSLSCFLQSKRHVNLPCLVLWDLEPRTHWQTGPSPTTTILVTQFIDTRGCPAPGSWQKYIALFLVRNPHPQPIPLQESLGGLRCPLDLLSVLMRCYWLQRANQPRLLQSYCRMKNGKKMCLVPVPPQLTAVHSTIRSTPHNDFNARVGADYRVCGEIIGRYLFGSANSNGLLSTCSEFDLVVTNTRFQQKNQCKDTWLHPRSKQLKHSDMLGYVLVWHSECHDVLLIRCVVQNTGQIIGLLELQLLFGCRLGLWLANRNPAKNWTYWHVTIPLFKDFCNRKFKRSYSTFQMLTRY